MVRAHEIVEGYEIIEQVLNRMTDGAIRAAQVYPVPRGPRSSE